MRLTRDVLGAVVLGLAAVGAASAANNTGASASSAAQHRNEAKQTEHLSTSGSVTFAPGDLTEGVTLPPNPALELSHGYEILQDLDALGGPANEDVYGISQKPYSSYEAVVDSTSGDIGPTLLLRLIDSDGTTVVKNSDPVGVGFSRSLRWINALSTEVNDQTVRVQSGQCTTDCGPDDVYFIRGYETTYSIPRFNNFGTQTTVLLLQNPTDYTIHGTVYFWNINGGLAGQFDFLNPGLGPKQVIVLITSTVPGVSGIGGTVTIANDGRYGDLSAKTVALEPATGFSFDSPALPRVR
jgi:hypothetical protein